MSRAIEKWATKPRYLKNKSRFFRHILYISHAYQFVSFIYKVSSDNVLTVISKTMKYLLIVTLVGPLHALDMFNMGCQVADSCLWQTCIHRGGSAWSVVNCDVNERDCNYDCAHKSDCQMTDQL